MASENIDLNDKNLLSDGVSVREGGLVCQGGLPFPLISCYLRCVLGHNFTHSLPRRARIINRGISLTPVPPISCGVIFFSLARA